MHCCVCAGIYGVHAQVLQMLLYWMLWQSELNVCSCLVNETNLVDTIFPAYFVSFIYDLYMFRTSPGLKHVEVVNKTSEI